MPAQLTGVCIDCGVAIWNNAVRCRSCSYAARYARPFDECFWNNVDRSGGSDSCWLWTRKPSRDGYGVFWYQGNRSRSHRVAWELAHGPIPHGMDVLHNCPGGDNPLCVNPAHLWLGTRSENNHDRASKGRSADTKGERHNGAKLTSAEVLAIRAHYADGSAVSELATRYGIDKSTVYYIVQRKLWKHLS